MRLSTRFSDERRARIFCDYLLAQGIETEVRDGAGEWELWVLDDEHIEVVIRQAQEYEANPGAEKYQQTRAAKKIRRQQQRENRWAQKNYVDARTKFLGGSPMGRAPVTMWLIGIAVALSIANFNLPGIFDWLSIIPFNEQTQLAWADYGELYFWDGVQIRLSYFGTALASLQFWRVLTPIFLHGDLMHLGFNMLWLFQLGKALEWRTNSRFLLILVVATGVPSNFLQYLLQGPAFLGMSGVVYGLLGYLWINARHGNSLRIYLSSTTYYLMFGWLAAGFFYHCVALGQLGPSGWLGSWGLDRRMANLAS